MKFFISYAGKDEKWAKWVVWELENAKQRFRCIAQFRDFAPGMNFMEKMRKAAEAESTLALFSGRYFKSNYCTQELDAALTGTRNRLLPVRIEPCDPGAYLRNRIHIDLVAKPRDLAREALLNGVEAYVTQTLKAGKDRGFRQRQDFPGPAQTPVHRAVAVEGAVIGATLHVLFLAPAVGGLSPRKQLREMQSAVSQARNAAAIRFKGVFHVHVNTLFEELNRESPQVFHFSGKQSGGDILMKTEAGNLTTISDMALAGMFQSLDQGLKLVVIDTCASLRCAARVAKVVPCAMGVDGSPYEEDTVAFYRVFYQAIASGRSLKDATAQAQTALKFRKVATCDIPRLCCRPGLDPASVFLVNPDRRGRPAH
jgi:hypothetical protein